MVFYWGDLRLNTFFILQKNQYMITQKKIGFSVFLIGFLIFLNSPVYGATTYERTPAGKDIYNPIHIHITFDDWTGDLGFVSGDYYQARIQGQGPLCTYTGCFASSTKNYIDEMSCGSIGDTYSSVELLSYPNSSCSEGTAIQNKVFERATGDFMTCMENPDDPTCYVIKIGEVPAGPSPGIGGIIVLPGNALSSTTAMVGDTIGSILIFLELAIGVPLAFWVVKKWLALMP